MAEKSIFWETNGTGDGTGTGFTDDELFQVFRSFCQNASIGGVIDGVLNELAASGSATPVAINTGQALVYGIPYFNSASVNVAVSTPAVSTRIDRIVLRADWTAQTVRITRIAGVEGGSAPAITQTPGTTYDIKLCQVSITTGGVITLTDEREFIGVNATAPANTMKGNFTGSTAQVTDTSVATVLAQYINAAAAKTTAVGADKLGLIDTEAADVLTSISLTNLLTSLGFSSDTFTPTLLINDSETGITYISRAGSYWKIAGLVFFQLRIVLSSKGAGSGAVTIGAMPFEVAADDLQIPHDAGFDTLATSAMRVTFEAVPSTSTLRGRHNSANSVTNAGPSYNTNNLINTMIGNATIFFVHGWYKAA